MKLKRLKEGGSRSREGRLEIEEAERAKRESTDFSLLLPFPSIVLRSKGYWECRNVLP